MQHRAHTRIARVLVATLTLVAGAAAADVESAEVRAGVTAHDALDYESAVQHLQQALTETLTTEEQIVTYRNLAFAHVALDRPDDARLAFESLLGVDPTYEPDRTVSPRVRSVFERARAQVAMRRSSAGATTELALPTAEARLDPPQPRHGAPLTVEIQLPGGLARRLWIFHRTVGDAAFTRTVSTPEATGDGLFRAALPAPAVAAPGIEYYAVVLDEAGSAVARRGSLAQPLLIAVSPPPGRPSRRRPWWWVAWTGGVALTAGGALAGAIALGTDLSRPTVAHITLWPR